MHRGNLEMGVDILGCELRRLLEVRECRILAAGEALDTAPNVKCAGIGRL
ncbi:MAG TPA: hypothetical protein VJT77_07495 [Burkholderiales bacterium]|nr:hypothetical protein [Burkholderiales bacterium]